jgi:Holliday junction resolvasome RuvABC endonuclease subunit
MFLGLDISTSAIGLCIVEKNKKVKLISFLDLSKEKTLFSKAEKFKNNLLTIKSQYNVNEIAIEENLQAFRPGLSSAKTIVSLARFNGVCTYISSEVFGITPKFMNVNAARKLVGIKINRKSDKNTKEQILDFVKERDPSLVWPTKILKGGPRKGSVVLVKECYDMADAYVIAQSAVIQEENCLRLKN